MNKDTIRLTPRQKEVIRDLQNGGVICTNWNVKGAEIGVGRRHYHIDNGIFWRLVNKGLIFQNDAAHNNYELTMLGRTIKL